ncbi:ImpE/SciE family protein [Paraburkholderia edwinii]|uniref:ImpE/SciE family protein n=1 Tax=Paraburkholderia edwinii TaxID=2861782 RepID=A0ABX8UR38_9BURK|nr:type VI secretion system accessory protein TagJ [Paraburkholderia edwinii]QYD69444.1 ImpE/SciE family protein [Paraburkholderia edwinii]
MGQSEHGVRALAGVTPHEWMLACEARVRAEPAERTHRWTLAQALCVAGEWQRALQQLQTLGLLDRTNERLVQLYRDLIRAERWREKAMAGIETPAFIRDDVPAWMRGLLDALDHHARGNLEGADRAREHALDLAPLEPVVADATRFDWISDSDTRFGPVCEIIAAGSYRWVAFADLRSWRIERPSAPIDFVWAPCVLTLKDGAVLHGFMPARYPLGLEVPHDERDALLTGSRTIWQDVGRTGVIGAGLKTWTTPAGDFGVFELNECSFEADACGEPMHAGDAGAEIQA